MLVSIISVSHVFLFIEISYFLFVLLSMIQLVLFYQFIFVSSDCVSMRFPISISVKNSCIERVCVCMCVCVCGQGRIMKGVQGVETTSFTIGVVLSFYVILLKREN